MIKEKSRASNSRQLSGNSGGLRGGATCLDKRYEVSNSPIRGNYMHELWFECRSGLCRKCFAVMGGYARSSTKVGWLLMIRAYYNEIDSNAAQWLSNLIAAGHTQINSLRANNEPFDDRPRNHGQ
ncbi:hypothetical protein M5J15_07245 [Serratia symbiotica]|uniref:hypothetical protein n=1 Tax=Serratia symbiotica TaxID=138074 RepID=UPI0020912669|nr:hypothetical protein [Serratia symbiotica]USS96606.1 hypothetical protein M5J15_07245 [Serratia symbiotica]